MRIAVAQSKPVAGDVERNIAGHLRLIDLAASLGSEVVVFPELSITGYEPALAANLATSQHDPRFKVFQDVSDRQHITIGVGTPTRSHDGLHISMILFRPKQPPYVYSKMYLHSGEEAFFVPGPESSGLIGDNANVALAICYELSVTEHAATAFENGADIYIASAVEPIDGIEKSLKRLAEIAREYSMTVLMSNCVGPSGGWECAGRTSVWNKEGDVLSQLDDVSEGVILIDTETQDVVQRSIDAIGNKQ